jgi:hypothetical protein
MRRIKALAIVVMIVKCGAPRRQHPPHIPKTREGERLFVL